MAWRGGGAQARGGEGSLPPLPCVLRTVRARRQCGRGRVGVGSTLLARPFPHAALELSSKTGDASSCLRTVRGRVDVPHLAGGLVFEAHRPLYHSTLGLRVIMKKKTPPCTGRRVIRLTSSKTGYASSCLRGRVDVSHLEREREQVTRPHVQLKQLLRERGGRAVCQRWGGHAI